MLIRIGPGSAPKNDVTHAIGSPRICVSGEIDGKGKGMLRAYLLVGPSR